MQLMTVEPLTALPLSNECAEFSYVIAFKYVPESFLVSCTRFWCVIFPPDLKYFKCNISIFAANLILVKSFIQISVSSELFACGCQVNSYVQI